MLNGLEQTTEEGKDRYGTQQWENHSLHSSGGGRGKFLAYEGKFKGRRADGSVIKTDAYGHGAVRIAKLVEPYPYIWGFAVAAVSEGLELRAAGITKPILILGYTFEEDYEAMIQTVSVRQSLRSVWQRRLTQRRPHRKRAPIHIAVDTGMSRIGFADTAESILTVKKISGMGHLSIEGVFTHFARADETDKQAAMRQMHRFTDFCDAMEASGVHGFLRHCSNSAGILELPMANMDMVRAGITIYGIYPSDEVSREIPLAPVMELKSHVMYIKMIERDGH